MRKSLAVLTSLLALTVSAIVFPTTVAAHSWSQYCTSGPGLLVVAENANMGGLKDSSCNDDDDWGDTDGHIRSFHDKMTSYHLQDDPNTSPVCARFFMDILWLGGIMFHDVTTGHLVEDNVGEAYNDKTSSHKLSNNNASTCGG